MWNPRVGGEKATSREAYDLWLGSPPHGRGKVAKPDERTERKGITPAWAGKRAACWCRCTIPEDHPRMGGEKLKHPKYTTDEGGSPPHGRGKVLQVAPLCAEPGITPAWAGKSKEPLKICEKQEDHPRVGGEKLDLLAVVFSALGSPPRGRGKDVDWLGFNQFFRITPAWAGKSHLGVFCREPHRDHPRVGGEKRDTESREDSILGSPPRGRGKDLP